MIPRVALAGLLILVLPSCHNFRVAGNDPTEGANPYELTDNAGYSQGGFYGNPADTGHLTTGGAYPAEGQTFGGYDSSSYSSAYPPAAPISDQARVAPFSEHGYGYAASNGAPYASQPHPAVRTIPPTVRKPVAHAAASTPRKKSPALASTGRSQGSRTTAGTKGGTVVKAVYDPSGSSVASTRKKATIHRVHTVQRGDTLSALASRYDVSIAAVKKRNQLTSDLILVGQQLSID